MGIKEELWITRFTGTEIKTGRNSQIRTILNEAINSSFGGVVTFRKWARYCTVNDKMKGFTKEEIPFRPTKDGLSFSSGMIPQIITELQKIYDYALENDMIKYDPSITELKK
jgi:hypothetical protein